MPEVMSLGLLVADIIARPVGDLPPRGRLSLVESIGLAVGGCAANTAICLSRFGASVAVAGRVGADGFGDFVVRSLTAEGVDVCGVRRDPALATSATVVLVSPDGERSFLHSAGANAAFVASDVDLSWLDRVKALHVGGALLLPGLDGDPLARILKAAQERDVLTSLDTAYDARGRWLVALAPVLPYVDCLLAGEAEAEALTGEVEPRGQADFFLARGVSAVAIKRGEKGAFVCSARERLHVPAVPVPVVDTTGAGDAFAAGVVLGLVRAFSLERTARVAAAAGAACVRAVGATSGIGSLEEIEALAGAETGGVT
jgi:sugar/nucleoside kinase (ribokinase family)